MASLLPCAWSYVEITTGLLEQHRLITHAVYGDWVGYFSMPETVEMVEEMRSDFDALVAEEVSSPARLRDIAAIFATSSRLERGFWEMAYTIEQWPDLLG